MKLVRGLKYRWRSLVQIPLLGKHLSNFFCSIAHSIELADVR
ncbi:hypothetical protein [Microcoleus sp. FACHB-831]|nr:hypothetical protein [Microcoleus sp. FACHB-831]